jgi:hypothetical protein
VLLDHPLQAGLDSVMQHIGKENRERLVTDKFPRAPHRMAQAEGGLLPGETRLACAGQIVRKQGKVGMPVTARQRMVKLEGNIEMVFDGAFVATCDKNEMFDAGSSCLVNNVLDNRTIDDWQHFLRDCLCCR